MDKIASWAAQYGVKLCSKHRKHVVKKLRSHNESLQELNNDYIISTSRESLSTVKQQKV